MSGMLLEVEVNGQNLWLLPWTARYFPVAAASSGLTVLPQSEIVPTSSDPLQLTAILYQQGDIAPVIVERALTGIAAAVSGITGMVEIGSVTIPAPGAVLDQFTVPPGITTIAAFIGFASSFPIQSTDSIVVQGLFSGVKIISPPNPLRGIFYEGPVVPFVDTQILFGYTNNGAHSVQVTLIGYAIPPEPHNNAANSLWTKDVNYNTSSTPFKVNVATGGNAVLLAPPATNMVWELSHLAIWAGAAFTAASFVSIEGTTSGMSFVTITGPVGSLPFANSPLAKPTISEGLTVLSGGTGVTSAAGALARQIPAFA